ncbi:hypothetical protein FQR65_LT05714 [Abscondita terminalis]|nr:hypothetical protein FQR65_LT05714 [Abscondita terminalis]
MVTSAAAAASNFNVPTAIQETWIAAGTPYYSECQCETGADITKSTNILKNLEFPDDACNKCFMRCLLLRVEAMFKNGTMLPESWVGFTTLEIAKACVNETEDILDTCEKAYEMSKCVVKATSST